jgi:predicted RNA-binding protein Jag
MEKEEIQNLITKLIEKTGVVINEISVTSEGPDSVWVSVEVSEPHFYLSSEGEGLHALNHIVHRIVEGKTSSPFRHSLEAVGEESLRPARGGSIIVDINGFQKKRVENIRAVAHMMGERARYFKSSIEVDPMSPFERRIVHEFLSSATDLKTESIGVGYTRRVVIKYVGGI